MYSTHLTTHFLINTGDLDYDAVDDFPFYYPANSPLNTVQCVNVTIRDDDVIEPDQSFEATLSTNDPVFIEPISQATIVIVTDNDSTYAGEIIVLEQMYRVHAPRVLYLLQVDS